MKNYLTFIMSFFLLGLLVESTAQSSNIYLLQAIDTEVEAYAERIDMDVRQKHELAKILLEFRQEQAQIGPLTNDHKSKYRKALDQRNEKIKNLLGNHSLKVMQLFEEINLVGLYASYKDIYDVTVSEKDLSKEIIDYRLRYILPVLSKVKSAYLNRLSMEELLSLKKLQSIYYAHAENAETNTQAGFKSKLNKDEVRFLYKSLAKMEDYLADNHSNLAKERTAWSKIQYDILTQHFSESQIKTLKNKDQLKAQFKLDNSLFILHVLMIEPYNKELYFQNLEILLSEESAFLQMIIDSKTNY